MKPLLNGPKWELLKLICINPQSPKSLAEKTDTSMTNVLQQLALLEAHGLVDKEYEKRKGPGKPKTIYSLKKEFLHITQVSRGLAHKKTVPLRGEDMMVSLILGQLHAGLFDNGEDAYYLTRFFFENEHLIRGCTSIGHIATGTADSIELLVLTENLEEVRKTISNQHIRGHDGKLKKIVVWSHSESEIISGIKRKEKYFLNFIGKIQTLYDAHGFFNTLNKSGVQ